jgi:hypothetical protein
MALLQLVSEERIGEEAISDYFDVLYRIVCVGEKTAPADTLGNVVRSTYIVDWEQLVHLLEDYSGFGEDIVEVTAIKRDEGRLLRTRLPGSLVVARA